MTEEENLNEVAERFVKLLEKISWKENQSRYITFDEFVKILEMNSA